MLNFLAAIGSAPGGGGSAFESIATATGTGSSGTITFSSIPSTYQHLQIRGITRSTSTNAYAPWVTINGDTGSNYATHQLEGNGSAVNANGTANYVQIDGLRAADAAATTGTMGAFILDIHDYASTTKNKTIRIFSGADNNAANTNYRVSLASGLWRSTSAVTSLTISITGNWTTSSTFALYGIKGA